jgi:hypothetical protein
MSGPPHSTAAERNKAPIADVLASTLPDRGVVLEIASGTGQHVAHFAASLPHLHWQPTEVDPDLRDTIRVRIQKARLGNVADPLALDVLQPNWPITRADAVLAINLLHISPWAVTEALFRGASDIVGHGSPLVVYGPFNHDGAFTSDGNRAFDRQLRKINPQWGIRDIEAVIETSARHGFALERLLHMPANNVTAIFRFLIDEPPEPTASTLI